MNGLWILVGMMGAGKSTVGRLLAEALCLPFLDSDTLLQNRLGRSIPQIFSLYGEAAFRDHESSVLRCLERQPGVLATGGGIVLREENWEQFRRLGTTIFLDVPPSVLKERLRQSKRRRPLLEFEDWEDRFDKLYAARREFYLKADRCLSVQESSLEDTAAHLATLLGGATA